MKKFLFPALFFLSMPVLKAQQLIHWTQAGSPYMINQDMTVYTGQTLVIDPDVEVIFTGHYEITNEGTIKAKGTEEQPITFKASDTTGWWNYTLPAGGWRGIRGDFVYTGPVTDTFVYCIFQDMKHGSTGFQGYDGLSTARNIYMKNCTLFHNQSEIGIINVGNTAEISDCNIYNNVSDRGIVYFQGSGGSIAIRNSRIHDNKGGFGIRLNGCDTELIEQNEIFNNKLTAEYGNSALSIGGVYNIIRDNKIYNNFSKSTAAVTGGTSGGQTLIEGNLIADNSHDSTFQCGWSDGGGGLHLSEGSFIVRNNVIANNFTNYKGGGVYMQDGNMKLINNTIVNNSAQINGAGLFVYGTNTHITVRNNIFYNNENLEDSIPGVRSIFVSGADLFDFNYNFLTKPLNMSVFLEVGSFFGDTLENITAADPDFSAPTTGIGNAFNALGADFSILDSSFCVNKGDTTGIEPGSIDFIHNPRVIGRIDIGAYETNVPYSPTSIDNGLQSAKVSLKVIPNPAQDFVEITLPEEGGTLILRDMNGRILRRRHYSELKKVGLKRDKMAAGIYFIGWRGDNGSHATKKIVFR